MHVVSWLVSLRDVENLEPFVCLLKHCVLQDLKDLLCAGLLSPWCRSKPDQALDEILHLGVWMVVAGGADTLPYEVGLELVQISRFFDHLMHDHAQGKQVPLLKA